MKLKIVLEPSDEGGYTAIVPSLPGCVSEGDTKDKALRNVREAIELYLEDVREAGEPIPVESDREYVEVTAPLPSQKSRPIFLVAT